MKLTDPAVLSDRTAYPDLVREWNRIAPVLEAADNRARLLNEMEKLNHLCGCGADPDLMELASEDLTRLRDELEQCEKLVFDYFAPKDSLGERSVILEIRAGAGGDEAALFASDLFRMYAMYAQNRNYRVEVLYANETERGGYREIDFSVSGAGAYTRLQYESGVHRVQRVPVTESQGRIQTSTVTVAVLPEPEPFEVTILPQDIRMESFKSSGSGGQHINKTQSAVRLIHIPTGTVVECQEERSQLRNREKALKHLEAILYHRKQSEQKSRIDSDRRNQVGTGERCERIRTYNYPQGRVTDHRIGVTLYSLNKILNGDLDVLTDALISGMPRTEES